MFSYLCLESILPNEPVKPFHFSEVSNFAQTPLGSWAHDDFVSNGGIMATQIRLPSRFPVGTHYVVEGEPRKGGQLRIVSRYVVMPSGVRYDLMTPAERMRQPADLARKGRTSQERPQSTRR
jgi:hypothetical protein